MRIVPRIAFLCILLLWTTAAAQPSPYESVEGNIGTWKWGKGRAPRGDSYDHRETGETSWERLNAERDLEETDPGREESRGLLSPLRSVWQQLRGKSDK
jgi:hypothetical protein